ncbi:MAG TPA: tripartite tricarboxylate transporter substrate binding protein [Burkholderiales bacterium]|nr:tripartite tricarboxylate transporter substrate binding protein [Burkholderiales bacterium]
MRHRFGLTLLTCMMTLACAANGLAQTYPAKPIRFYTPYPPGGTTDILARLIGAKLYESWGQPVIVDAKPGAGGNIGTDFVAKSPADGYTILMGASGPLAINVSLFSKLPYDPVKDLAPVILTASVPLILVTHPSLPAKNVKEFIALMKSRPGQFNYASAGPGSPQHLTAEMFKFMAKVDMAHIPYKGSGPAIVDLVGGQIPFAFESMIPVLPHVKAGKLRALAVTSAKPSPVLPEIPTVAESGVPGFESIAWYGVVAPAGTPRDIIAKLNAEMARILNLPDIKQRLIEMGSPPVAGTPDQFGALIKSEIVKWGKVVKQAHVSLD